MKSVITSMREHGRRLLAEDEKPTVAGHAPSPESGQSSARCCGTAPRTPGRHHKLEPITGRHGRDVSPCSDVIPFGSTTVDNPYERAIVEP